MDKLMGEHSTNGTDEHMQVHPHITKEYLKPWRIFKERWKGDGVPIKSSVLYSNLKKITCKYNLQIRNSAVSAATTQFQQLWFHHDI